AAGKTSWPFIAQWRMPGWCTIIRAWNLDCWSRVREVEAGRKTAQAKRIFPSGWSRAAARRPSREGDCAQARHADLCIERWQGRSDKAVSRCPGSRVALEPLPGQRAARL